MSSPLYDNAMSEGGRAALQRHLSPARINRPVFFNSCSRLKTIGGFFRSIARKPESWKALLSVLMSVLTADMSFSFLFFNDIYRQHSESELKEKQVSSGAMDAIYSTQKSTWDGSRPWDFNCSGNMNQKYFR